MNASHHIDKNIIAFDLKEYIANYTRDSNKTVFMTEYLWLEIIGDSEIFEATVYLRTKNSLDLISDGMVHQYSFTYSKEVVN